MSLKVLVIGSQIAQLGVDIIEKAGGTVIALGPYTPKSEFIAKMREHQPDALIVRAIDFIDQDMIAAAGNLQVIAKHGVGVNEIDVVAADAMGIPVVITTGANSQSVAEHAFAMAIALCKDILVQDAHIRKGVWDKRLYSGTEMKGRTFGIVGFGSIGRHVADMAKAFGMHVLAFDPVLTSVDDPSTELVDLDTLMSTSDIVSLHCPATETTRNLIDARRIGLMKPTAYFINTARGDVVDELALIEALEQKRIAGAGLDVFAQEPPQASALWSMNNVIHSPHIAGVTKQAMDAVSAMAAEHLVALLIERRPVEDKFYVTRTKHPRKLTAV